jgi:probable rRNA maturation factor
MSARDISVILEEPGWKKSGVVLARVKAAARLALAHISFLPSAQRGGGAPKGRRGQAVRRAPSTASRSPSPTLRAGEESGPRLTLLLTNDERLRVLNARFRGKDTPTNVLSFPAADADPYLGDIAIALEVTAREAATAGISLQDHTLHLAVHGVLHLLGYDHVRNSEARVMERLEIAVLDELGIPSPYARANATSQRI